MIVFPESIKQRIEVIEKLLQITTVRQFPLFIPPLSFLWLFPFLTLLFILLLTPTNKDTERIK